MAEEEKQEKSAPAERKEGNKGFFTGNLSGWQIFIGLAVAAYLTYGKWQEMREKSAPVSVLAVPPAGVSYEGAVCVEYREGLRKLVHGSASTVFRGGVKQDRDLFGCNAEDATGSRRAATLSARRVADPALSIAEYSREFKPPANFQMTAEPDLGPGGFQAIGSYLKSGGKEYLAYFGQTPTHVVEVSLAKGQSSDPELSDEERKMAKALTLSLMQSLR